MGLSTQSGAGDIHMTNDLSYQLITNKALWQRWTEFGITSGLEFKIDFEFYTDREDSANALIAGLEKAGYTTRKVASRKLLIFKDWHITGSISQPWTLEALNDRTRQLCRLADMLRLVFDGCGAYMPSQRP
jgi:hypothetical protein